MIIGRTYQEVQRIVSQTPKGLIVRWYPSKKVERIFFESGTDHLCAEPVLRNVPAHRLKPYTRSGLPKLIYFQILDPSEPVRLGDMLGD